MRTVASSAAPPPRSHWQLPSVALPPPRSHWASAAAAPPLAPPAPAPRPAEQREGAGARSGSVNVYCRPGRKENNVRCTFRGVRGARSGPAVCGSSVSAPRSAEAKEREGLDEATPGIGGGLQPLLVCLTVRRLGPGSHADSEMP